MLCFSYSSACPGATRGQSVGFPLKEGLGKHCPGVSLHARRIILGSKWSLVCQRVRAGSSRLDEIDDELDWDAVPAQVLRIHLWPRMHLVLGPARNK